MKTKISHAAVGLILGTSVAGGIFVVAFALTGNAMFIPFIGVGSALGLIMGAMQDRAVNKG